MGTTTPNLGLYKPAGSETGWASLVNANMDVLDTAATGVATYLSKHLIRYVDYANGSDSAGATRGLGPGFAFKTIQAAYNDLKTVALANYAAANNGALGVGRIILLPGDHDVGAGVSIDSTRPVELVGFRAGENDYYAGTSSSRIYSSSSTVTELVLVSGSGSVGHGVRLRDLHFRTDDSVNTSLTKIVHTKCADDFHVDHCTFLNTRSGAPFLTNAIIAIYMESVATDFDSAWFRIRDCLSASMGFFYCVGPNFNRCVMDGNVCFNSGTNPTMHFAGDLLGSSVTNNNLEGTATAIRLDTSTLNNFNVFSGNGGESADGVNPFYDIATGGNNVFIGGICDAADGSIGTWVKIGAGGNNLVIGNYTTTGRAGWKQKVVDNSGLWNGILHPNWGFPIRRFTSSPVTDSLFAPTNPPDGTQAVTDVGGVRKLWVRTGGAWYSTAVS